MTEYIERELALKTIRDNFSIYFPNVLDAVRRIPAADVQPVDRWISVKDRQPDEDGWYLVCKHNRVRVAEWYKDCWYNESDLPIDDCAITYWQPLPEPPKDGDTNE